VSAGVASARGLVVAAVTPDSEAIGAALASRLSGSARVGFFTILTPDEEVVETSFERAAGEAGELSGLVVAADLTTCRGALVADPDEWTPAVTGCLRAAFLTFRRAIDEFIGCGAGGRAVILVRCSSAASAIPAALCSALTSLARAVASEYGRRGITCNTVVLAGGDSAVMDAAVELVGFLLSDDAGYVTGDVIDLRT
jgi:NAD(P)-dependent dehydrogenase (short-subunit alcohol dehydrogenase family)